MADQNVKQTYRMVDWAKVNDLDDLKLVLAATHGELGFSEENIFYNKLVEADLLGEPKEVTPQVLEMPKVGGR